MESVGLGNLVSSGIMEYKIGGGSNAIPNEFPFMAHLQILKGDKLSYCGGAILDTFLIITAAHCVFNSKTKSEVHPSAIRVTVGEYNTNFLDGTEQFVDVSEIMMHEDYDYESKSNDIAILGLSRHLKFNETTVTSIPYPIQNNKYKGNATVMGWGLTFGSSSKTGSNTLQKATLKIMEQTECSNIYKEVNYTVENSVICAGDKSTRVCKGDSGGPLVCKSPENNGNLVLCGIVSVGWSCSTKQHSYPGIFSDVSFYRGWIQRTIRLYTEAMIVNNNMHLLNDKIIKVEENLSSYISKTLTSIISIIKKGFVNQKPTSYANVHIYEKENQEGSNMFLTLTGCRNIPLSFPYTVHSINTYGSCVIWCPATNCTGDCKMIHPGFGDKDNLNPRPLSLRPCTENDQTALTHGDRRGTTVEDSTQHSGNDLVYLEIMEKLEELKNPPRSVTDDHLTNAIEEIKTFPERAQPVVSQAIQELNELSERVQPVVEQAIEEIKSLPEKVQPAVSNTIDEIKNIPNRVRPMVSQTIDDVKNFPERARPVVTETFDKIEDFVRRPPPVVSETLKKFGNLFN